MTHTILKSALAPPPVTYADAVEAFGKLVAVYIAELKAWHDHDVIVRTQKPLRPQPKWKDFAKDKKTQAALYLKDNSAWKAERLAHHDPYKPPVAHSDIVASVVTTIAKDGTATFVADFEVVNDDPTPAQVLQEKKTALLRTMQISLDAATAKVQLPAGKRLLADIRENAIRVATKDATDVKNPDDVAYLKAQEDRRSTITSIIQKAAQAMSDIEDLTVDNVDAYKIPNLD
jgi:hypothetical protein